MLYPLDTPRRISTIYPSSGIGNQNSKYLHATCFSAKVEICFISSFLSHWSTYGCDFSFLLG